ncbi:hypothetical protein H8356DRAFT_1338462 [Neocallimastix lanati (nom. inval.)]|nr:hypothetical protein H8356DRAFT_1338462 [Neocallimastix sp. JGI-2020a]
MENHFLINEYQKQDYSLFRYSYSKMRWDITTSTITINITFGIRDYFDIK